MMFDWTTTFDNDITFENANKLIARNNCCKYDDTLKLTQSHKVTIKFSKSNKLFPRVIASLSVYCE